MGKLIVVTRSGDRHVIEANYGNTVMEVITNSGFDELAAVCGGCSSCATCHVYVDVAFSDRLSPLGDDENDLLDSSSYRTPQSRLSCLIDFEEEIDGLEVTIAPEG